MMSFSPTIDRLRIEAFRGFRDPHEFDLSASAVIVTGPNGTGKTSFFDALQWVLIGRIERLERLRSRRNVEHIVSQYRVGGKAKVELDLSLASGQVTLRRAGDQSGSTLELSGPGRTTLFGDDAESELRRILLPSSELSLQSALTTSGLMQQDVLRGVLEAKPDERYRQLSTVLGLGSLEDFEDATKAASKEAAEREGHARTEHSKLSIAINQAEERLQSARVRLTTRPQVDAMRNEVVEKLRATPENLILRDSELSLDFPDDVRRMASMFSLAAEQIDSVRSLARRASELHEDLREGVRDEDVAELQEQVMRAAADRESAEATRAVAQSQLNTARLAAAEVAKLAALAIPMLSQACPVCGQSIDARHVEQELLQKAEATGTLLELENSYVNAANAFSEASTLLASVEGACQNAEMRAARWQEARKAEQAVVDAALALAEPAVIQFVFDRTLAANPVRVVSLTTAASEYLASTRRALYDFLEAFDRQSDQSAVERAEAELMNLRVASEKAAAQSTAESSRANIMQHLATKTLEARVEVTESRLRSIQPLVADIYHRLDPHPAFKTVEFELDTYYRKGRTSPLVIDSVANVSADPLLIFSTSQANIVALSYFIAMSLSTAEKGLPFLLLDDPVQSMDDVNVLGFADLCRHLREQRQLIVSTHERRLSSLLERKLAPRDYEGRTKIIRFTGWDRSGPTVDERLVDNQLLEDPIRLLNAS